MVEHIHRAHQLFSIAEFGMLWLDCVIEQVQLALTHRVGPQLNQHGTISISVAVERPQAHQGRCS